jgi:leucyl-tRNA synthetase
MICVNGLTELKSNKKEILEKLVIFLAPFAPHISEELWHLMNKEGSVVDAPMPEFEAKYLIENEYEYPVSFNGKMRFKLNLPLDLSVEEVKRAVMANETTQKWTLGSEPKKVIVVPGKIINVVV